MKCHPQDCLWPSKLESNSNLGNSFEEAFVLIQNIVDGLYLQTSLVISIKITDFRVVFLISMSEASLPISPISLLMQRYQASGLDPEFKVRKVKGADHSPIFEATVEVL